MEKSTTLVGLGIFQLVDSKTILTVEMLSTNSIHLSNAQTLSYFVRNHRSGF